MNWRVWGGYLEGEGRLKTVFEGCLEGVGDYVDGVE